MIYRCWLVRFKSEVPSIRYVLEQDFSGQTLVDIGANKGVYSIYMSRAAGPDGKVIAFEAQPELGRHLEDVKEGFDLKNLEIVNKGLSSSPGILKMRRDEIGSGGAGFHNDAGEGVDELEVPVITLDRFFADRDCRPIRFIKCDVERHEFEVFRGGEETLRRDMPILLFECFKADENRGEIFSWLADLGYDGHFFYVRPEDHVSLLRKGRGEYVHYSRHAEYDYVRPSVENRNYLFLPRGRMP